MKTITLNITSPITFTDMSLDVSKGLTMMTGMNGTGKTFILVNVWALGTIAAVNGMVPDLKEWAQYVYDHSFADQNIDGNISGDFNGKLLTVYFEKGKITSIVADEMEGIIPIKFMSSGMRTFDDIGTYLKVRKMGEMTGNTTDEQLMSWMVSSYKLYDVMYIEHLIKKCPIDIKPNIRVDLEKMGMKSSIARIEFDKEKADFIAVTADGMKPLSTYSKGEQSILNMVIGAL